MDQYNDAVLWLFYRSLNELIMPRETAYSPEDLGPHMEQDWVRLAAGEFDQSIDEVPVDELCARYAPTPDTSLGTLKLRLEVVEGLYRKADYDAYTFSLEQRHYEIKEQLKSGDLGDVKRAELETDIDPNVGAYGLGRITRSASGEFWHGSLEEATRALEEARQREPKLRGLKAALDLAVRAKH